MQFYLLFGASEKPLFLQLPFLGSACNQLNDYYSTIFGLAERGDRLNMIDDNRAYTGIHFVE